MARVLIVDDSEMDRLLHRKVLQRAGHELFFAKEGEEAMKLFIRKDIQVVVTDLKMPNVDGLELIAAIHDLFPQAAIVAVSGVSMDDLENAAKAGAVTTLRKPVDPQELADAVAEAAGE